MKKILSNKWVHILLFLSIIVNAFLAGFIFSREGRRDFGPMDRGARGMSNLAALTRYLPAEQKREFFHTLRSHKEEFHAARGEIARINKAVLDLLAADEIDQEELEKLLAAERELHIEQISRFQQSLINGLMGLPLEQRRAVLEQAHRNFEQRRPGPGWGRGPHPDDLPPPPGDMPPPGDIPLPPEDMPPPEDFPPLPEE